MTDDPTPEQQPSAEASTPPPQSCRELAQQLLRLPTDLLGSTARKDLARHLDGGDWVAGDLRSLRELAGRLADHIERLSITADTPQRNTARQPLCAGLHHSAHATHLERRPQK